MISTQYRNFRGMSSYVDPALVQAGQCRMIKNGRLTRLGQIQKRNGSTQVGNVPAVKAVQGLHYHESITASCDWLVHYADGIGYYNSAGTWTSKETGLSATEDFYMKTFTNLLFRTNKTDGMKTWTGAAGDAFGTTNAVDAPAAAFLEIFEERMCALGTTTNPSRLFWSSIPSALGAITWTTGTDYLDVYPDDGQQARGMVNLNNMLVVWKDELMVGYPSIGPNARSKLIARVGTTQSRSISASDKVAFFFRDTATAEDRGFYMTDGYEVKNISHQADQSVHDYIEGIAVGQKIVGYFDGRYYYAYVGNTMDLTNVVMVYDSQIDEWVIDTVPGAVRCFAFYNNAVHFGTATGEIVEYNDPDNYDDYDGTDISFEVRTMPILGRDKNEVSQFYEAFIELSRGDNCSASFSTGATESDAVVGTAIVGESLIQAPFDDAQSLNDKRVRFVLNKIGHDLSVKITHAADESPPVLKSILVKYNSLGSAYTA